APSKPNILLTAGVHGDEPAGVEAILQFLERDPTDVLNRSHILVLPCVNPSGYANDTRENIKGEDINRAFNDEVPESTLVKQQLSGRRFNIFLDMHEDYDATGTYFYEGQRDKKWLAPSIAQEAKKIGPLDVDIDDADIPLAEGVFEVDPAWAGRGFTSYVYEHHTNHAIIAETSSNLPMSKRVKIHLLALDMIIGHYTE
ncbi:MAG: M14 family metallocarboxypeptidase, partial [Candidatus Latescibacteria bacterium]|nr:M14 family metallocarboxypeptidase [Candidatus Latescibacterota bacterium]